MKIFRYSVKGLISTGVALTTLLACAPTATTPDDSGNGPQVPNSGGATSGVGGQGAAGSGNSGGTGGMVVVPPFSLQLAAAGDPSCPLSEDGRSLLVKVQNTGANPSPAGEVTLSTVGVELSAATPLLALQPGEVVEVALPRGPVAGFRETWEFEVTLDGGDAGPQAITGTCMDELRMRARVGMEVLHEWYDEAAGLYSENGGSSHEWWRGANMLEVAADVSRELGDASYLASFESTFEKNKGGNFINEFYDDEGWWALAFLKVYDLTHEQKYLDMAKVLFDDIAASWDEGHCGGGVYWKKETDAKTSIANELFFVLAGRLHHRTPGDSGPGSYLDWAQRTWDWFENSGLIGEDYQVIDGLDFDTCEDGWDATFTYNQGVIIGGLVELWRATSNDSLMDMAVNIADATMELQTTDEGIFVEAICYPECGGGDGIMFKGPFVRNLALLYEVNPQPRFRDFLIRQSNAIWTRNRNEENQLGQFWPGPPGTVGPAQQAAALDALVGAVRVGHMNHAISAVATGSGACAAGEGAERAIDGNARSKWCAPGAGNQSLNVDLGSAFEITGFVVKHASSQGEDAAWNTGAFEIEVSLDGVTYDRVVTVTENTAGVTTHYVPAIVARHVRLHITQAESTASGGAARIFELEALGVERAPL